MVVGDEVSDCCPDVGSAGTGDPERGVGGAVGMGVFVGSAMIDRQGAGDFKTVVDYSLSLSLSLLLTVSLSRTHAHTLYLSPIPNQYLTSCCLPGLSERLRVGEGRRGDHDNNRCLAYNNNKRELLLKARETRMTMSLAVGLFDWPERERRVGRLGSVEGRNINSLVQSAQVSNAPSHIINNSLSM